MKIIMLDIDGVLNFHGTEDKICGYIGLCPERISRLNRITDAHPDAKIVVSSTWRKGMPGKYESMDKDPHALPKLLKERGVKAEVIDHTRIRMGHYPRGDEIREWIEGWQEKNPGAELTYVILDDDDHHVAGYTKYGYGEPPTDVVDMAPYHVKTDWCSSPDDEDQGGLMDSHVDLAIRILNGNTSK